LVQNPPVSGVVDFSFNQYLTDRLLEEINAGVFLFNSITKSRSLTIIHFIDFQEFIFNSVDAVTLFGLS
jgi:hypothetical protein